MDELKQRFEAARIEGLSKIEAAEDLDSLEEARVRVLGRKADLTQARHGLRDVPEDQRKELGRIANEVQQVLESALEAKKRSFAPVERAKRWEDERIDVTLPGSRGSVANLHPLTQTMWQVIDIFIGLGYKVAEGPEVELSEYNFDALNTPAHAPQRAPQDTYYIEGTDRQVCLRTQTSPMQIRYMEANPPPVYVVVPGRCYRPDEEDPTHLAQFTQLEGLAVDEGITMGDLKGTLSHVARELFGRDLDVRLRPHFFPFTEPSAEMDVQCFVCRGTGCRVCGGDGWIELLGCGMVHPALFERVGYDPERFTGFAFGMGIERAAALASGVVDIRYYYENDIRFLSQFGGVL